jgi:hypothetical protein
VWRGKRVSITSSHHAIKVTRGALYQSSEHGRWHFCPDCGAVLLYTNQQMLSEVRGQG